MTKIKTIRRILKVKKNERTIREEAILYDWLDDCARIPLKVIFLPIRLIHLIVKLYKWTYKE